MAPKTASRYKPHPMLHMEKKAKEKIAEKTGKTFEAWVKLARSKGPKTTKELSAWFREQPGIGMMEAHWLTQAVLEPGQDYSDPEPMVDALYSGDKARLRPLHESVVDVLNGLGDDVIVTACQTMVPAYRKHVFAELRPASNGVLLRLALGQTPLKGRLEADTAGMPGERLTHAVTLRTKQDVNAELKAWLAKAYELGSGAIARSTEFTVPPDFKKGVAASKPATATWASMTPAMQRDMVQWIDSAKQAETRQRRLATALEKLADGKKRVY